ncbi:MAG: hypothetical protein R3B70_15685 [Polyangiaceae bacterium]
MPALINRTLGFDPGGASLSASATVRIPDLGEGNANPFTVGAAVDVGAADASALGLALAVEVGAAEASAEGAPLAEADGFGAGASALALAVALGSAVGLPLALALALAVGAAVVAGLSGVGGDVSPQAAVQDTARAAALTRARPLVVKK